MFEKQTLLILGAGASRPYGFPLGDDLIKEIISSVRNDCVLFPCTSDNQIDILNNKRLNLDDYSYFKTGSKSCEILNSIRSHIKTKHAKELLHHVQYLDGIPGNNLENNVYRFSGQNFVRIKLDRINELHQLANMLEDFDPVSIDAFLRDHREHRVAGQAMIIYCLIRCHNNIKFKKHISHIDTFTDKNKCLFKNDNMDIQDNWYRHLLNDIKSGCHHPSDLLKNNLSIATFNYDVSLDYYLKNKLTNTSYFKDHASDYLDKLKICHIYGSICDFDDMSEFYNINLYKISDEIDVSILNLHHLLYGYVESSAEASRIKLIGERQSDLEISEKIRCADTIYFIGFSFDSDNLSVLGFPRNFNDYREFFAPKRMGGIPIPKKIFYLDYKGMMNALHDEFQELCRSMNTGLDSHPLRPKLIVQRSIANSITSAYVNDFKNRIFT